MVKETFSEQETFAFAKEVAKKVKAGMVVCLDGDLGTGKTAFAKGFAKGLGIEEDILSPTFTIVREYRKSDIPLFHFDVYRISDLSEMDEIGYEDYFFSEGISLVEWSKLINEIIPEDAVRIVISKDMNKGFDYRKIEVKGLGDI